ncbi:ketopantoate reductase family protein [Paenibacillus sp. PAMC21692]|uniref:ketopantoate reductase family protein n=1 Tax=Paenibacillus sp. PAMC21692 TaxID=2762320 RepID=UPI0021C2CFA7|nr:hypothetical protein [Paenibacillus sp. PAMC21692]
MSVNTEQLPEAAQLLLTVAGTTPVLLFNNVWQDLKSSISPLSMNNVVFEFPGAGGGIADNRLRGGFLKMLFLEKPRAGTEHINNKVKELFESAHFKISWVKDMQSWLWNHFAMNAAMETEVLRRGSFPALMNHSDSFANVGKNMREIVPVLKARGATATSTSPFDMMRAVFNFIYKNIIANIEKGKQWYIKYISLTPRGPNMYT